MGYIDDTSGSNFMKVANCLFIEGMHSLQNPLPTGSDVKFTRHEVKSKFILCSKGASRAWKRGYVTLVMFLSYISGL